MSRRFLLITFLTSLAVFFVARQRPGEVWGFPDASPPLLTTNQTVPTRTPTPPPATPTSPPQNPTATPDGGGNPTAVPTSTIGPTATETIAPVITVTIILDTELLPTAETCSNRPTIQAQNPTNVRLGPGTDYPVVSALIYLEVRPILGRAADAAWWLVELNNGAQGWVADDVVAVQGYAAGVPIAPAPELDGNTPTPGSPWNPTPIPSCTVTPTTAPTATNTATVTAVSESGATPTASGVSASPSPTETRLPEPTQTAVAPPTLPPTTSPALDDNQTVGADTAVLPAATPLNDTPTTSATDLLLPIAGALLLTAVIITILTRKRQKET